MRASCIVLRNITIASFFFFAGGIRVGTGKPLAPGGDLSLPDGSDGNTIAHSTFVWGSHVFHEGQGVLAQKVSKTTIQNNEVAYFQTGIR